MTKLKSQFGLRADAPDSSCSCVEFEGDKTNGLDNAEHPRRCARPPPVSEATGLIQRFAIVFDPDLIALSTDLETTAPLEIRGEDRGLEIVDIGAYEFQPQVFADLNVDGVVDVSDLLNLLAIWG